MLENLKIHKKPGGDGKGGIYFGATGCGKSYTMLFLARRLATASELNNPTIVLLTDRTDLDDQLSEIFEASKEYLINEKTLRQIQNDLAKPMSRLDSELDYLRTQYISDFAKFLGYDGVKYFSTFDKTSYNVALFDSSACNCTYRKIYLIGDLQYEMTPVH